MAGGLLTLAAIGAENIILNGNPSKTFFKAKYNKYTNFGMQRFRIDHKGLRILKYNEDSILNFKIPRYADMLHDVYVVLNLPIFGVQYIGPLHPKYHTTINQIMIHKKILEGVVMNLNGLNKLEQN